MIPETKVQFLIGKEGRTVKKLAEDYDCKVNIDFEVISNKYRDMVI
jgi:rRNA processing protein Krr1/Pno1